MIKEKKLLLIASIISIIYSIISLVFTFFDKSSNSVLVIIGIVLNIIVILSSICFLYYSLSNVDIEKKKTIILLISVLFFINNIISGIIGFVVFKRINSRSLRDLPKLDIQTNYKWYIYLLVFIFWAVIIFGVSNYFTNNIQSIIMYISFILIVGFIFRKDLVRDFKCFISYFNEYSSIVFSMFGKSFVVLLILTISIRLYTGLDTASNQEMINKAFEVKPLLISALALIYAPFVEELLFRGIFRKLINKKWLFIITSGFLFGFAHVIDDFQNLKQFLFILVYSSLGCFLASTYHKTNNLFTNIMFHFIQNLLAIIGMIIVIYFSDYLNLNI